jgi:fructose-1,6-bisphosphatase
MKYSTSTFFRRTRKTLKKKNFEISTEKNDLKQFNLTMDGTAIKTIARSNPFVLVLENGKIVEKKSLEDFLKH